MLLKFTCDFAVKIATLKEKLKTIESQYQRRNVVSQIASMANVLILLNLPSQMRLAFFKFLRHWSHFAIKSPTVN